MLFNNSKEKTIDTQVNLKLIILITESQFKKNSKVHIPQSHCIKFVPFYFYYIIFLLFKTSFKLKRMLIIFSLSQVLPDPLPIPNHLTLTSFSKKKIKIPT